MRARAVSQLVQRITGKPNVDGDYHVRILAKRLRRTEKDMSNRLLNTMCRAGFMLANGVRNRHSCVVKVAKHLRRCATEQGIEAKSQEFMANGAKVCRTHGKYVSE